MKRIDNIGFVGGDTRTLEFDFGTKVAGSVVECPIRLFFGAVNPAAIQSPVNANGTVDTANWVERNTQAEYDNVKAQDNVISSLGTGASGKSGAVLAELDLTPLCNALFGGSNSALKAALKSIQADVWATGSGSNSGVLAYGVQVQGWWGSWTVWSSSTSSSITKVSGSKTSNLYIDSNNKVYIMINAQYASNGTIASTVNLDYIKVTLQFTRIPDVLQPIPKSIGKEFTIVLKGFSPAWDNTQTLACELLAIITQNYTPSLPIISFRWADATKKYALFCKDSAGVSTDYSVNGMPATLKFQIITFAIRQDANGIEVLAIVNGTTILYKSTKSPLVIIGDLYMYLLQWYSGSQANGYLESIFVFDEYVSDRELEVIMRGRNVIDTADSNLNILADEYKNPNLVPLFNDSRWTKHANTYTSDDGKTLTLVATASNQNSAITIPVLPNNKYSIKWVSNSYGIQIIEMYGTKAVKAAAFYLLNGVIEQSFVTTDKTTSVRITLVNGQAGTFTYTGVELTRID